MRHGHIEYKIQTHNDEVLEWKKYVIFTWNFEILMKLRKGYI